jgi:predicted Zn-ribbon and HTH transcriptional regulator
MSHVILPELVCKRCGHKWLPRIRDPVLCPKCKSARWKEPKEKAKPE